jgi:hypothetical protein
MIKTVISFDQCRCYYKARLVGIGRARYIFIGDDFTIS